MEKKFYLSLVEDRSKTPFKEMVGLCLKINRILERECGGDIIIYSIESFEAMEVIEQEAQPEIIDFFEAHGGTLEKETFPHYVPRQEVYDTIETYAKKGTAKGIRRDIDNRFPEQEFENLLPSSRVFDVLCNEYFFKQQE